MYCNTTPPLGGVFYGPSRSGGSSAVWRSHRAGVQPAVVRTLIELHTQCVEISRYGQINRVWRDSLDPPVVQAA